jgi:hypothetical protein
MYKIIEMYKTWHVYSGHMVYNEWVKDDIVYSSTSIADCYAWVKAKEEGLLSEEEMF